MITPLSTASQTRNSAHGLHFKYDINKYNFKELIETLFGCQLDELHQWLGAYSAFDRRNDQHTLAHRVFYSNYKKLIQPVYTSFMHEVLSQLIQMPFSYQVVPTFRVGLPGNRFVGEYHKDSKYLHPDFELNFNLALSNYAAPCCLMSERIPGSRVYEPIECMYGEIFSFNHIDCMHGSELNSTDLTMCSFDFRVAMLPFYKETSAKSINMNSAFKIGEYFSSSVVNKTL